MTSTSSRRSNARSWRAARAHDQDQHWSTQLAADLRDLQNVQQRRAKVVLNSATGMSSRSRCSCVRELAIGTSGSRTVPLKIGNARSAGTPSARREGGQDARVSKPRQPPSGRILSTDRSKINAKS